MAVFGHFQPFLAIFGTLMGHSPWLETGPGAGQKRVIFDPFLDLSFLAIFQGQNALFCQRWPEMTPKMTKNGPFLVHFSVIFGISGRFRPKTGQFLTSKSGISAKSGHPSR